MLSLDDSQCQLADDGSGNNESALEFFFRIGYELEPVEALEVSEQYDSVNANSSQAVLSADTCDTRTVDGNIDSSHRTWIRGEELSAVNCESEVLCLDTDKPQCSAVQQKDENFRNDVVSDGCLSHVNSDVEPLQVIEQHCDIVTAQNLDSQAVVPSADLQLYACCDKVQKTDDTMQECLIISVDEPENESCVTDVAQVEIQEDKSDTASVPEETDSDCIIQDVFGSEAFHGLPAKSEHEMAIDLLCCDHTYSISAKSNWHSAVVTSSDEICRAYTSHTALNLSTSSLQAQNLDVTNFLPFPSLITHPNIGELSESGQHTMYRATILPVASMELMATSVSRATGLIDANSCVEIDNSSYPVVEIVPCNDEGEVDVLQLSDLSTERPRPSCVADTADPPVANSQSDNTSLSITSASCSRRVKASILFRLLLGRTECM